MEPVELILNLITTEQLQALRTTAYPELRADENRGRDPVWHVGHLCVDFAKVLVTPFRGDASMETRYAPAEFATLSGNKPWETVRPTMEEVVRWVEDIRAEALLTLRCHAQSERLPKPVDLFTAKASTIQEALIYAIYHNSYHFGCAHSLVGERLVVR